MTDAELLRAAAGRLREPGGPVYADGHRCTCGTNGTPDECDAEVAAGGWCPSRSVARAVVGGES